MCYFLGTYSQDCLLRSVRECANAEQATILTSFISYRTGHYKLHYYETPTNLKFVMVTDTKTSNLRIVLHQIYVSLFVEYGKWPIILTVDARPKAETWYVVVKNPLSPLEHPGGIGVNCELFELGLEQFIVSLWSFVFHDIDNH